MTTSADIHAYHLTKLRRACTDTAQTCQIAELSAQETVELIMSGLLLELIKGAAVMGFNEADFIKLCRIGYRASIRQARQGMDD
jgi:hypothetical protein